MLAKMDCKNALYVADCIVFGEPKKCQILHHDGESDLSILDMAIMSILCYLSPWWFPPKKNKVPEIIAKTRTNGKIMFCKIFFESKLEKNIIGENFNLVSRLVWHLSYKKHGFSYDLISPNFQFQTTLKNCFPQHP